MKRQDIWTLMTTFIVGTIAGGYVYVMGFAPQFEQFTGQTAEVYEELVIVGEQYGGEGNSGLPSFQVLGDGSFVYLSEPTATPEQGTVPRALLNELGRVTESEILFTNSQLVVVDECASFDEGIEYRYEITQDSVIYDLDTCGTDFTNENLREALDKLWKYFRTLES